MQILSQCNRGQSDKTGGENNKSLGFQSIYFQCGLQELPASRFIFICGSPDCIRLRQKIDVENDNKSCKYNVNLIWEKARATANFLLLSVVVGSVEKAKLIIASTV
jgi:hypothetical protein